MIATTIPAARNGHHRWSRQMEKTIQIPRKPCPAAPVPCSAGRPAATGTMMPGQAAPGGLRSRQRRYGRATIRQIGRLVLRLRSAGA
jgi:hypothetical protein